VPRRVHGDVLAGAGRLTGELDAADADVLGRVTAREQPLRAGAPGPPVGPQQVEQLRREHDQARLAAGDARRHARAVALRVSDVDSARMTPRVAGGKARLVMLSPKLLDLLRTYRRAERPRAEWLFSMSTPAESSPDVPK